MARTPKVDALIFEDTPSEVDRIVKWFELAPRRCRPAKAFPVPPPRRANFPEGAEFGWNRVCREIRAVDPKVVVMDWLLTGESGEIPFSGIEYGVNCKRLWPDLGVIVVTTGGDGSLRGALGSQKQLDAQKERHGWPVDYAWVKPWGPSADYTGHFLVAEEVAALIERSLRPSQHR